MDKNKIRHYAKELRKTLQCYKLSSKIHQNLLSLPEWKKAVNIFCYYSVNYEVDTKDLILLKEKNWFLPKISDNNLLVCPYKDCSLKNNKYNIPEPDSASVCTSTLDMIIIPALAADKNGYRVGYGGGYYDRFLSSLTHNPLKVVLVYSDLFFDNIFPEKFDVKCDIIITDKQIYKINC